MKEDSLEFYTLLPLTNNGLTFTFDQYYIDESDDLREVLDSIGQLIISQCIGLGITDSVTQVLVTDMAQLLLQEKIGIIYFNEDQNDLFGMDLLYQEGFSQLNAPVQYNGAISAVKWQVAGSAEEERAYGFQYDNLTQMTDALYAENTINGWTGNAGRFDERNIEYDQNGNITRLHRYGIYNDQSTPPVYDLIDDLFYNYNGNQLKSVQENQTVPIDGNDFREHNQHTSDEYGYDANGNLIRDDNKGITSLSYNHLNQPVEINFGGGNKIQYIYDANGNKLAKKVFQNNSLINTLEYSGSVIYETGTSGNRSFQLAGTPEGRMLKESGSFKYQYYLTDHLGNIRVVFEDTGNDGIPDIVQSRHYYPFGLTMGLQGVTAGQDNRYLYQGKELQPDAFSINGSNRHLEWYDFSARNYDPQIGRWHVPDPADQFSSPYLAMGNNPVSSIDPTGCNTIGGDFFDRSGYDHLNAWHAACQQWMDGNIGRGTAGFIRGLYADGFFDNTGGGGGGGGGEIIATSVSTDGGGTIFSYGTDGDKTLTQEGANNEVAARLAAGYTYSPSRGEFGRWVDSNGELQTDKVKGDPGARDLTGTEHISTWVTYPSEKGGKNVPGGDWDSMGEGSVPYNGKAWFGTNFVGPGPNVNPYALKLRPVDAVDKAAQRHDYYYWKEGASGIKGALFHKKVAYADAILANDAYQIMLGYKSGAIDQITGFPISERTYNIARGIYYIFTQLYINKIFP